MTVTARERYPRFDSSAVDGYAFMSDGPARCVGTVAAGELWTEPLVAGTCVRIFTGAMPPPGTRGVLMQEDVLVEGDLVTPQDLSIAIRRAGSDFEEGDVLLSPGDPLNAGAIALLASQGIDEVDVYGPTMISILTTGDELVFPYGEVGPVQVRDSNLSMLNALGPPFSEGRVKDDAAEIRAWLEDEAGQVDVIVIAGGASVGDRDLVPAVVAEMGEIVFHGVNMRPGKPLLFGRINGTAVFGLPGNPASAFVCYQLFVRQALDIVGGDTNSARLWIEMPFGGDHEPCGREDFTRVEIVGGEARPVGEQASFGLRSLAAARALARLPADRAVRKGEPCQVLLLDPRRQ